MANVTPNYDTLSKKEFDELARQPDLWIQGPEIERQEHNAPYDPTREVRGILKDGRKIRAEVC
jgi:hypothetical protein